jgi:hypothetical protein
MPNKKTFSIKPIGLLIDKHVKGLEVTVDPFARESKKAKITNDIDPSFDTTCNMDALEFLKTFKDGSVDLVLFDPPYSPRQVSECYKKLDLTVNMKTTQASFWGDCKKEIGRILKQGGKCITFGWNSGGVGMKYGMKIYEILLVPHGGWHNDTICTVEIKSD